MAMAHKVLVSNLDFPILVRSGFGLSTQACKKCFFIFSCCPRGEYLTKLT